MSTLLITAQALASLQTTAKVVVLDCRFSLADTGFGQRVYDEGHIPGACYLHLDHDLSSPITAETGRHPLPEPEALARRLRACGVNRGDQVVVYDDCGGAMAARAWWALRWLGHNKVAVLDGGYPAWLSAVGVSERETPAPEAGDFEPQLQAGMNLSTGEICTAVTGVDLTLVDARNAERYRGELEPIDPVAGHIPGAINRPMTDNLVDGVFKSPQQLAAEWQTLLAGRNRANVVHYCGSGVTACHNLLAMEIAGLSGSRIYSGSWSEWIRDPQRPIVTD